MMNYEAFWRGKCDLEAIEDIIDFGVSANSGGYDKHCLWYRERQMTPLMIGVYSGDLQKVQFSIENGADLNAGDIYNVTATHVATYNNYYKCLKVLLETGASCSVPVKNAKNCYPFINGTTPLHLAAGKNYVDCLKELLRYGADCNAVDEDNVTPLYLAAQAGHGDCVQALLDNAKAHRILSLPSLSTGDTPLHFVVQQGMVTAVKKMLELGADVNHRNKFGQSSLHACTGLSVCKPEVSLEILKLLVLHGHKTDVNLIDAFQFSPLHYATLDIFQRQPEMASFLIAYGANINIFDHNGFSLTQSECFSSDSDVAILKACVETLNVPPALGEKRNHKIAGFVHMTKTQKLRDEFQRVWLSDRNRSRFVRNFCDTVVDKTHPNAIKKRKWYKTLSSKPRSLKHTCRNAVRSIMGYRNLIAIKKLPLPKPLQSYLVFEAEMPSD